MYYLPDAIANYVSTIEIITSIPEAMEQYQKTSPDDIKNDEYYFYDDKDELRYK